MVQSIDKPDDTELERVEKLRGFAILDTPQEHEFDAIVMLAQRVLDVPIALVSLVDDHRQWFKAKCGIEASETPREDAFCSHAIHAQDIMVVEDATLDPRFADNPFVTGAPGIRFYAGVPLRPAAEGYAEDLAGIGTLCVVDTRPRTLSPQDVTMLREIAGLVSALIRARAATANALRLSDEARCHAALLERQHLQLRQAERMAAIGSWRLDFQDQTVHWSDQVYAIHGLPPGEMPSVEDALAFYPPDRRAEIAQMLERCGSHGESFDFESDFFTADRRARRVRSIGEPQLVDGQPVAVIGVFQDITERHAREQLLRHSADTDALTGLPNRACLDKRLAETVAQQAEHGGYLLMLDLDGFKAVNDTFGHAAGDDVLRVIADRLRQITPPGGFAARLGGDEFVLLLTGRQDCLRIESIVSAMLSTLRHAVERDGRRRSVSATVGGALLDARTGSAAELLRQADLALYDAKRARRGTGRIFGSPRILIAPGETHAAA
jgi:diguanylate cyclase (GGDEF)-like protein/PAS domain S-box-containing protein